MVAAKRATQASPARAIARRQATRERLLEIGKLLLTTAEVDDVLGNIARGICELAGYERCLIASIDGGPQRQMRGRAGHGVALVDVPKVQELMEDVPVLEKLSQSPAPLILQPGEALSAIPQQYLDLFHVEGTLIVLPLFDQRLGAIGLVFADRAGAQFDVPSAELAVIVDFVDLATLAVQNAILLQDSQQLAALLERNRIATELHDGVTQNLFALSLTLQELHEFPGLSHEALAILECAQRDVHEGSAQLRKALFELTQDLGPEPGPVSTFETALRELGRQFSERSGVGADLEVRGQGELPPQDRQQLLLRAAREGLNNALKHAEATQVTVVLRKSDHWWMIEVHDDGLGDATAVRRSTLGPPGEHFGLQSLRREAGKQQGRLWVSQSPRLGGVQLTMSLPVQL
jgi:signal transduction histidine kinase